MSECRMATSISFEDHTPRVWSFDDLGESYLITESAFFCDIEDGFNVPCYPAQISGVSHEHSHPVPLGAVDIPKQRRRYVGVPIKGCPMESSMYLTLRLYLSSGDFDMSTVNYEVRYFRRNLWFLRDVVSSLDCMVYYDDLPWDERILKLSEGKQ